MQLQLPFKIISEKKNAAKNCAMLNAKHVKMQKIESSQNNKHCIFFPFQDVRRMICLRTVRSHVTLQENFFKNYFVPAPDLSW